MDLKTTVKSGVIMLPYEEVEGDTLSPSRIRTLQSCEAKWWFRYVKGLKIPPSGAAILGSSYDDAQTTSYIRKLAGDELSVQQVCDAFATSFGEKKHDADWMPDEDPDEFQKVGIGLTEAYQKNVAPLVMPANEKSVQKKYEVSFEGVNWKLIGFADVITVDGTIIDNKTIGRTPTKILVKWEDMEVEEQKLWQLIGYDKDNWKPLQYMVSSDYHFQMLCYAIAEKSESGTKAGNHLIIDYAVKLKTPKVVRAEIRPPTTFDIKFFQQMTAISKRKMDLLRSGALPPTPNRSSYLCSKKYCGYWSMCEEKFGGKV
jgi:hypothetical protein